MKKIYQIFINGCLGLSLLALTVSCGDFLEITPRDLVTEDNFWDEKADVDQMVTGCYTALQSQEIISRCIIWGDMRGDDIDGRNVSSITDIYQALLNNLLPSNVYTDWGAFYHVINKCNTIIRMAPEVSAKDPSYRSSDVQATIAEVTALRSLCYWYLIRAFKDVPFTRKAIQQEDEVESLGPTAFDNILNELISDLESVKPNALEHYATTANDNVGKAVNRNCNRITRNAIRAMLCDMYLWRGDYDKVIENMNEILESKKKDAEKMSSQLKNYKGANNLYNVYLYGMATETQPNDSYNAIFGGDGNSYESIFELAFNSTTVAQKDYANTRSLALGRLYGGGHTGKLDELGNDNVALDINSGVGWFCVTGDVVSDGTQSAVSDWKTFRGPSDTRFFCSMQAADDQYGEATIRKGVAETFNVSYTTKYENYNAGNFILPAYLNRNWIFYRLTDVMLMGAEAYIMKSSDDDTPADQDNLKNAFDLIDIVNQRSVLKANEQLHKSPSTNRALLKKEVRRERRCELMFEGKRFFDIIRYCRQDGDLLTAQDIPDKCNSSASSYKFPSYEHLFWPYNKNEVKVNTQLNQKSIYNKDADSFELNN